VRDPRVTERCVPSRLDSCIGDDPARRRGARPRSPGDASGLRAHRFRARCLYRGPPHLVASLARRPPDGRINPKRRENTTRARTGWHEATRSNLFPSLRGNADRKRLRPLIRVPSSGGKLPDTVTNPEWAKATAERMKSWEREGAPDRPIKLNPIKGGK